MACLIMVAEVHFSKSFYLWVRIACIEPMARPMVPPEVPGLLSTAVPAAPGVGRGPLAVQRGRWWQCPLRTQVKCGSLTWSGVSSRLENSALGYQILHVCHGRENLWPYARGRVENMAPRTKLWGACAPRLASDPPVSLPWTTGCGRFPRKRRVLYWGGQGPLAPCRPDLWVGSRGEQAARTRPAGRSAPRLRWAVGRCRVACTTKRVSVLG